MRSQYAISYKPADFRQDGRYRTIEILAAEQEPSGTGSTRVLRPGTIGIEGLELPGTYVIELPED